MKKLWGAALTVVAASSAVAAWAGPMHNAQAATPANSVYYHGTSRDAHFGDRATCERHARAEVKLVRSRPAQVTLIPAYSDPGVSGSEMRTSCYPVSTAQWSYLTAYFAKKGVPMSKYDHYVNLDTRSTPAFPADDEAVWTSVHAVTHPANYWSVATCNKYAAGSAATIRSRSSLRLLIAQSCFSASNTVGYGVLYSGTSSKLAFVRGDVPTLLGTTLINNFPMLDVLGYDYTYLSNPFLQSELVKRQTAVRSAAHLAPRR